MVAWLDEMEESVNAYKEALADVEKYSTELTAATSNIDFSNIENTTNYLQARAELIKKIREELEKTGNT